MLDWDSGDNWNEPLPDPAPPRRPIRLPPRLRRLRWLLLPLALSVVALVWTVQMAQTRQARLRADLQAAADLELWAWQRRDEALFDTLIDPGAPLDWRRHHLQEFRLFPQHSRFVRRGSPQVSVEAVEVQGDSALVTHHVRVPDFPTGPLDYTQVIPYQRVGSRWLRAAPDPALWGAERHSRTPHFVFSYTERDAAAVERVAASVEAFYAGLRAALDLDPPGADVWFVTLTLEPPLAPDDGAVGPRMLRLASPTLSIQTSGVNAEQTVKLAVGRWVGEETLRPEVWAQPLSGVLVWNVPLAVVERDTLRWAGFSPANGSPQALSQRWQTLRQTSETLPATLSVINYIGAVYGDRQVTDLVRAGRRGASTWDRLLPATLGVASGDFEAAWVGYVEDQLARRAGPPN